MTDSAFKPHYRVMEPNQVEIPPLEDAKKNGFAEVARLWRKPEGDEDTKGDLIITQIRNELPDNTDWNLALASVAQIVAVRGARPGAEKIEIWQATCNTLWAAAAHFTELSKVIPNNGICIPGEDHPGMLETANIINDNEDAQQILSIWLLPDEDYNEGDPRPTYIQGQTLSIDPTDYGAILAKAAQVHAENCTTDQIERLKIIGNIESSFHMTLCRGLPRA